MAAEFRADYYDGTEIRQDICLRLSADGTVAQIPAQPGLRRLPGLVIPGFVDLQVNGGDGVMFNDAPTLDTLRRMAQAHGSLGCAAILPTLITDTRAQTAAAIQAAQDALSAGVPGIAGLHLEGPHLAVARKGAHDAALIRPMEEADMQMLLAAAAVLPRLIVTLAPESVTLEQIQSLVRGGVLVSLGHSDCTYEQAMAAFGAGASMVTHLFNAMSPLTSRAPGLVGAALQAPDVHVGVIADGIHVVPASLALALRAKASSGQVFAVSDAMAPAGSDITEFTLGGRRVTRAEGRLTLADGTLAGADLSLARAVQILVHAVGMPLAEAVRMATSGPAGLLTAPFAKAAAHSCQLFDLDGGCVTPLAAALAAH